MQQIACCCCQELHGSAIMDHGRVIFPAQAIEPLVRWKLSCSHGQSVQSDWTIVKMCPRPCRNSAAVFLQNQPLQHSSKAQHSKPHDFTKVQCRLIVLYSNWAFPGDRNDCWFTCPITCQQLRPCGKSRSGQFPAHLQAKPQHLVRMQMSVVNTL